MRVLDHTPAWIARQRSRRLGRYSDEKVVRWISPVHGSKERSTEPDAIASETSSNDNTVVYIAERTSQAF